MRIRVHFEYEGFTGAEDFELEGSWDPGKLDCRIEAIEKFWCLAYIYGAVSRLLGPSAWSHVGTLDAPRVLSTTIL